MIDIFFKTHHLNEFDLSANYRAKFLTCCLSHKFHRFIKKLKYLGRKVQFFTKFDKVLINESFSLPKHYARGLKRL